MGGAISLGKGAGGVAPLEEPAIPARLLGTPQDALVERQLDPVEDEHPGQQVEPDQSDDGPGQRGHEPAEPTQQDGEDLGADDGQEHGFGRPGRAEERAAGAHHEQQQVAARDDLQEDGGLELILGQLDPGLPLRVTEPFHASELPALLWSDIFSSRPAPLNVSGPVGEGSDGLKGFLSAINDMAAPIDAFTRINAIEVFPQKDSITTVYKDELLEVTAIGVNHANKPTLAYKVAIENKSIAFGADQTLDSPGFIDFVKGADLLVLHLAISEEADKPFTNLHAKPSKVGTVAEESGIQRVVLSHLMKLDSTHVRAKEFSLFEISSNIKLVKENFKGEIIIAEDLECIAL